MINEKSAGIILFRFNPRDGLQFLVLYHRGTYWQFPKGKLDAGETEKQAALRELKEETGIGGVKLVNGWRQQTEFFFKEKRDGKMQLIKKQLALFLAKVPSGSKIDIENEKLNGYAWLDYKTAGKYLKFKNLKAILDEANSYIDNRVKNYKPQKKKSNKS